MARLAASAVTPTASIRDGRTSHFLYLPVTRMRAHRFYITEIVSVEESGNSMFNCISVDPPAKTPRHDHGTVCVDDRRLSHYLLAPRDRPGCRAGVWRAGAWSHQSRLSCLHTSRMDISGIPDAKMVEKCAK